MHYMPKWGGVCQIAKLSGQIWDHSKKSKNETDESRSVISDFLLAEVSDKRA